MENRRGERKKVSFRIDQVYCAGFSGRDQRSVNLHVEELKKLGVPAPEITPTVYRIAPYIVFSSEESAAFEVKGDETSAEVEFVALISDEIYVTVGSDHTDRWLERMSVDRSKQICPKIIGNTAWLYSDVKEHWDKIEVRSFFGNGEKKLYQEGRLGDILPLEDLLSILGAGKHSVVFSGTVPISGRKFVYSNEYSLEMDDPILERKIALSYSIKPI